jgi:hypothetical protein
MRRKIPVLLIVAVPSTLLVGCSTSRTVDRSPTTKQAGDAERERVERETTLSEKIRCADEGRRFVGSPPPKTIIKFAYNKKMNTCLCEETYVSKQDESGYVTDVLTNEILAGYSVSADHRQWTRDDREVVTNFKKLESDLFPYPERGQR